MNVLDLIPGISGIIDKVVPDPNKQQELKLELAKLDAQENIARLGMLGNMLSNKSFFVAGAIPAFLWSGVLFVVVNYVLLPLLAGIFGLVIDPLIMPEWYCGLLKTIIVCLLGKKALDGNEWRWGDKLISPAKSQVEAAAAKGDVTPVGARTKPAAETVTLACDYNDIAAVDARLMEIAKEKGIK